MQAHRDNQAGGNPSQDVKVIAHRLTEQGRSGPQPNKNCDHPQRKENRRQNSPTTDSRRNRCVGLDLVHPDPGHIT